MAELEIAGSFLGTALKRLLLADEIEPGSDISYQLCKEIYLYHPLGMKMAESPIKAAQSQHRQIAIPGSPEDRVRDEFDREWKKLQADRIVANLARTARIYGVATVVLGCDSIPASSPIDMTELAGLDIWFNVLDPLNTSGNGSANQNPNTGAFQRLTTVTVAGTAYHPSRACILLNEEPVYIAYSSAAFGFVGRSVYQRALFPLKTFVQSMLTDDMVQRKAGVLVAKIKQAGSSTDRLMKLAAGFKRSILREAQTENVISIGHEDDVSSLNLAYLDGAAGYSRKNVLENVATAADMPAKMLNNETFAEGFGEGTEDAKNVARYIDAIRVWMDPAYRFMDKIVQYRAWTPAFYKRLQAEFPDKYKSVSFNQAFYDWTNAFEASWPSLLIEPDSEKSKTEDVKLKAIVAIVQVLLPEMDPENKVSLISWAQDNINSNKVLFPTPLDLDMMALAEYEPPTPVAPLAEPGAPKPFGADA